MKSSVERIAKIQQSVFDKLCLMQREANDGEHYSLAPISVENYDGVYLKLKGWFSTPQIRDMTEEFDTCHFNESYLVVGVHIR